jgi:protein SCO1/2
MDRRTFLAGSATAGFASAAGCLGVLGSDSPGATENVVLSTPEQYDKLRESRDAGHLAYPIHADKVPEATLPDALSDQQVSTRQFVGDRHVLLTFIYTRCFGPCLRLTARLGRVQSDAIENGYNDEFAFLPTTFDPEYDTPERLRAFSKERHAVLDAGNWYALRPESEQRVEEVVNEKFGVSVVWERESPTSRGRQNPDSTVSPLHEGHDHGDETQSSGNESSGNQSDGDGSGDISDQVTHLSMIMLVNADGYIERTYTGSGGGIPGAANLLEDVNTLRERW